MRISNHGNVVQDAFDPNPEIGYGVSRPDGDASPWITAPVGSKWVQTGQPTIVWRKVASENADSDWVGEGYLQETFALADFTDGGAAVGTVQFANSLPIGTVAEPLHLTRITGFAGDTSAALIVGDGSDTDRYNTGTLDVFSAAEYVAGGAVSGTAWHTAAVAPTVTITVATDWGSVSAGSVTVTIPFTVFATP